MPVPGNTSFNDYTDLQNNIDRAVGKFGVKKTVLLLQRFLNGSSIQTNKLHRAKLVSVYIISQTIVIFDCDERTFYSSQIPEYKEARMASYYLLRKYTRLSHSKIGELFGRNKRHVLYYSKKCEELLSIPQFYPHFAEHFNMLEINTIDFIAKLN